MLLKCPSGSVGSLWSDGLLALVWTAVSNTSTYASNEPFPRDWSHKKGPLKLDPCLKKWPKGWRGGIWQKGRKTGSLDQRGSGPEKVWMHVHSFCSGFGTFLLWMSWWRSARKPQKQTLVIRLYLKPGEESVVMYFRGRQSFKTASLAGFLHLVFSVCLLAKNNSTSHLLIPS